MDRRKIENDLLNSSFTDMQSEALSYLMAEMATKEDIRELRSEMHGEFRAVHSEMASEFRAVRGEMASEFRAVRGEMQVIKSDLLAAIADSNKHMMEAIVAFQNKLFTHVLALIGALTAIITLLLLLIR